MDEDFSLDILYTNDDVPEELYTFVRNGLCSQLDTRLQKLPNSIDYLTSLTCHSQGKLSLLMVAAFNGYDEIIHLLLTHCDPIHQIELKGNIIISDEISIDGATALYCACYRGHFTAAKILIEFGKANINQNTYDAPYYPLLIHATTMNRLDIVCFLVENRYSDVNETKSGDCNQSTALIWAAFLGYISIVEYLIVNGADVNYSCADTVLIDRTPLLCAISAGFVESVRLLYEAGADITIKNKKGDTPLKIAVNKKHYSIINFLLEQFINTLEDLEVIAYSLISISSPIEKMNEVLELLKLALRQRELMQIPRVCIKPIAVYDYQQECQTIDELDSIRDDRNRIFIETLLIRERMNSSRPDISIMEQLEEYADSLASNGELDKCLNVYFHIFYYYLQTNGNNNLYKFVWLFCKMLTANRIISVDRFIRVCYLTFEPSQSKQLEQNINNTLFLLIIATKILEQQGITKEEQTSIYCWVKALCRHRLTTPTGKTLLHLCVDIRTNSNLNFRGSDTKPHIKFPNLSGLRLLLTCGGRWIDIDATESNGNTPLHLICQGTADRKIIELLVNAGCHMDCVNDSGKIPVDYVKTKEIRDAFVLKPTPAHLKCLCARILANTRLNTRDLGLPTSHLNKFVVLHGVSAFNLIETEKEDVGDGLFD